MTKFFDDDGETHPRFRTRHSPSLFGPILLIAIGVYFLLNNLGVIPGVNWATALRLWPLLLIFVGVNIIVRQLPRPFGSFLSLMVALLMVTVFGYVLLFSEDNPLLRRFNNIGARLLKTETIEYGANDLQSAFVGINFSLQDVELYALEDSNKLIEGTVSYFGELIFKATRSGSEARITLAPGDTNVSFFLNPTNWVNTTPDQPWHIGLNPEVLIDLRLDMGIGAADLNLAGVTLSRLELDGGVGSVNLTLPGGEYDVTYDAGVGSVKIWLPESGRQQLDMDGGVGSITFFLPESMEARVEVNGGAGEFHIDHVRFTQVNGSGSGDGVWKTAGYDEAENRINLVIDVGTGSVTIGER
ncbi:MAG: LiaI-LiaF-like domain-containing protein [Anaerolineae bacterium]